MTDGNAPLARISKALTEKQSIVICLPTQATLDAVASGLALYFVLQKAGKAVTIASSGTIDPQFGLTGQENIQNTISSGGDTLVVSLPYQDGGVENVNYNVENDRLNILITPESGHGKFDEKNVSYSYTGGKPDAIITIYAPSLTALGDLYENHKDQFEGVETINIDRHFTNANYGTINFVDKKSPSMTQMVNDIMRHMKVDVDKDIASNLYDGLAAATQNFSSHTVNAQTFRMAAFLLEHGATRKPQAGGAPPAGNKPSMATSFTSPVQKPQMPQQANPSYKKSEPSAQVPDQGNRPPSPLNQNAASAVPSPVERVRDEAGDKQTPGTAEAKEGGTPSAKPVGKAQLKPQIFKGGGLNKG